MKLDKIKFARVIQYITECGWNGDIEAVDNMIDIELFEQQIARPCNDDVERLMALMWGGTQKIEAIKIHRTITGYGLKESKDAVERYWVDKSVPPKVMFAGN